MIIRVKNNMNMNFREPSARRSQLPVNFHEKDFYGV